VFGATEIIRNRIPKVRRKYLNISWLYEQRKRGELNKKTWSKIDRKRSWAVEVIYNKAWAEFNKT